MWEGEHLGSGRLHCSQVAAPKTWDIVDTCRTPCFHGLWRILEGWCESEKSCAEDTTFSCACERREGLEMPGIRQSWLWQSQREGPPPAAVVAALNSGNRDVCTPHTLDPFIHPFLGVAGGKQRCIH